MPKAIAPFAELERSPEHVHTYRLTPLGLWNARAAGHDAEQVVDTLLEFSRYAVPHSLLVDVAETMSRYGRLRLEKHPVHGLVLSCTDRPVLEEVLRAKKIAGMLGDRVDPDTVAVHGSERGNLKQALLKLGWPAEDFAGYVDGEAHAISLDESAWQLRDYQRDAAESFWHGGSGVVVLPCGAGKTLVGAAAMAHAQATTLILVTNTVSARQWKDELVRRTSLTEDEIGEYSGAVKEIRPVTIATYQVLTLRRKGVYPHLELLDARDWGLIIYDEVHLLPAPIFRMTANLQARRRIGLTATLVREDGREGDVFSLIGPKRYDAPWKDIESQGWIAPADCVEVRVSLPTDERLAYATAEPEERYRLAACTHHKIQVVRDLVAQHAGQPTLVIGQYLDQLDELAAALDAPVIKGETPSRSGSGSSRPSAPARSGCWSSARWPTSPSTCPPPRWPIQVSGSFGSRQEEAQRLGRLLRPKAEGRTAHFYTIVSRDTVDAEFAQNRQRFLAEQGYAYRIVDAEDLPGLTGEPDRRAGAVSTGRGGHSGELRRLALAGASNCADSRRGPGVLLGLDGVKVLLLENIHPARRRDPRAARVRGRAAHRLAERGRAGRDPARGRHARHPVQHQDHPAGARAAPDLVAIGCFCIGTNQVDLEAAAAQGRRGVQRAVLQHPQRRRAGDRGDHLAGPPAAGEDREDARGRLGQVGQGQPRGPRPDPGHRRLRQHRHPALERGRVTGPAGDLLRHRRPAGPRQRPPDAHPRGPARRGRRGHPAHRRSTRQRRLLRCRAVRGDEAALDVHQRRPRHGRGQRRPA